MGRRLPGSQKRLCAFEQCLKGVKVKGTFRDGQDVSSILRWKGDFMGQGGMLRFTVMCLCQVCEGWNCKGSSPPST